MQQLTTQNLLRNDIYGNMNMIEVSFLPLCNFWQPYRTKRPISEIQVLSAKGIKISGIINPFVGCFQQNMASNPFILDPFCAVILGW